jgi:hypothetical protein
MSESRKVNVNGKTILILFIAAVFFLAIGSFGGYRYKEYEYKEVEQQRATVIDSLNRNILKLEDSIKSLEVREVIVDRYITKYQTLYDTIQLQPDIKSLIIILNDLGQTPPK